MQVMHHVPFLQVSSLPVYFFPKNGMTNSAVREHVKNEKSTTFHIDAGLSLVDGRLVLIG